MWLTSLFVKRSTLVFVLIALISLAGTISWVTLVRQQYPNVSQPTIRVQLTYSGATTTVMRDSIVAPIEDQIAGSPNLQTMNSTIQDGQATIAAIFTLTSDENTDLVNVQKAVQAASHNLPSDLQSPVVSINDPSEAVVVTLSLSSSKMTAGELSLIAEGRVVPALEQVTGVSNVNEGGNVTPAYEVTVDPRRLVANKLTLNDVINTVANNNLRAPGGIVYLPNSEVNVDIRGDIITPESILGLPISPATTTGTPQTAGSVGGNAGTIDPWTSAPSVLRIADVAAVADSYEPRRTSATVSGLNGVFLQVQKASDASEVDASNAVIAVLPKIRAQFPDINFSVINVQSKYTAQQLDGVIRTLLEGIALTGIVMLLFLQSWRNAIVVLIAIPTSLGVALFMMKMLGLTLDTISLLGMTLVIGILVDDSTVVLENIERHFEMGQEPAAAAITGRTEIGVAAIVITLVDVVVFLPIAFIQSQVGRNLAEFGIVVVISTLTSLFVCFTITPSLAANWALHGHWEPWPVIRLFERGFNNVRSWYAHRVLPWGLRHRIPFVTGCLLSFVVAIAMIPTGVIGEEFIPPNDRGEIYIQVQYPVGTPLTKVQVEMTNLEKAIRHNADIDADIAVSGAYSAPFGGNVSQGNVGQIHIWLKDDRKHSTNYWVGQFRKIAQAKVPGGDPVVVPATGTQGGNSQPVDELVTDVAGGDPGKYAQTAYKIMQKVPGATSVISSDSADQPQVELIFDRARAQALNVSIGTAAAAARAAFGGTLATQFETVYGLKEVQVIYPIEDQTTLDEFNSIPIRSTTNAIVHLGDFATFKWEPAPPLIIRVDRNSVVHISANVAPSSSLSNVQNAFLHEIAKVAKAQKWPKNIVVRPAPLGQQDLMGQTLLGLGTSLVLSVVLVFLLMVALYDSYRSPFIILFSVPVAAVGAIGALWLTHETLNLFSLIGTILLVGLVTKNGILLVDYANTLRARGESKLQAIQESAFTRFRPIVMTSVSVIAGNFPLALALEPGSLVRSSLGVVVIGGITSSLILTLVLVPIMYMWLAPKHVALTAEEPPTDTPPASPDGARHPAGAGARG
jgi:HAE1 family hydrophobic/amphiphilic exporter-1